MNIKKITIIILAIICIIAVDKLADLAIASKLISQGSFVGSGGEVATKCETSISSATDLLTSTSSTILATSTRRSFARIQILDSENGIAWLSFDEGAVASTSRGVELVADSEEAIEFGLNTDFPYVGAVTGIATVATTTLFITECTY